MPWQASKMKLTKLDIFVYGSVCVFAVVGLTGAEENRHVATFCVALGVAVLIAMFVAMRRNVD